MRLLDFSPQEEMHPQCWC